MKLTKEFRIERTKKGHPALWECGGGHRNTGYSTIIAGKNGEAKTPVYIRRRGHLANEHHALFIVEVGDYIIQADHHREDFDVEIYQIKEIHAEHALAVKVNDFSYDQWDKPPGKLKEAVKAACEKALCYHCRQPHFYEWDDKND